VREQYVTFGPQRGGCGPSIFIKFEAWECWLLIIKGAETAFPCVQWHNHCCHLANIYRPVMWIFGLILI